MDRPRAESFLRVDLLDYLKMGMASHQAASTLARALILPHPVPGAGAALPGYVLGGFDVTGVGLAVVTVDLTAARALLADVVDGTVVCGQVAEDDRGVGTVAILTSAFSVGAGTYDLYLRWVAAPANAGNRAFWNDATAAETTQTLELSDVGTFDLGGVATGAPPPFSGGTKIAEVTVDGAGSITGIVPTRVFLFEGAEDAFYAPSWGGGALDRDPDRATNGIKDLATFVQYVRAQIQGILGDQLLYGTTPWAEVSGNLPSLGSLGDEHHAEGTAYGGYHKAIQIHGATAANVHLRFATHDGAAALRIERGANFLDFRQPGVASPVVRALLPAAGQPGGLLISGPAGPAADMGAGEFAHLRFGKTDNLLTSRDAAFRAEGSAVDASRRLYLDFGNPPTQQFLFTGAGDFTAQRNVVALGSVSADYDSVVHAGDFKYLPARSFTRSFSYAAFSPSTEVAAVPPGSAMALRGPTALGAAWTDGVWGLLQTGTPYADAGWLIQDPWGEDVTAAAISSERLEASLDCLPNLSYLQHGVGQVGLACQTDASWPAADEMTVAVFRRVNNVVGAAFAVELIAYVLFTPGTSASQFVYGTWVCTGAVDHVIDHVRTGLASSMYFLTVFRKSAAGRAAVNGQIVVQGVTLELGLLELTH